MASLVFPENYTNGSWGSSDDWAWMPMVGFQAIEIKADSGVANLNVEPLGEWAWLPIPIEGLTTQYSNAWESSTVNMAAAAAQAGISMLVDTMTGGGGGGRTHPDHDDQATNAGAIDLQSVGGAIKEFVTAKAGLGTGVTRRMLEQSFVSYSGPEYRQHDFSFSLKPTSKSESELIEKIILFFKKHSAPELLGGTADVVRLYKTPHLFEIKFAPNTGLFKIAASACTNVGVKYGGEKYNTFYDSDQPIQVDLSLQFKEMTLHDAKSFPSVDEDF